MIVFLNLRVSPSSIRVITIKVFRLRITLFNRLSPFIDQQYMSLRSECVRVFTHYGGFTLRVAIYVSVKSKQTQKFFKCKLVILTHLFFLNFT